MNNEQSGDDIVANLIFVAFALGLLLASCVPGLQGPGVEGPKPDPQAEVERTLYVTQRALPDAEFTDVYMTLLAVDVRTDERVAVGQDPTAAAYLSADEERCILAGIPTAGVCTLGNLAPGEIAPPVEIVLAPYVRLRCAASGYVGGKIQGYRPMPCVESQ